MPELVDNIIKVDRNGQFIVSTARYLAAIDKEKYSDSISKLLDASIEKDRDRKYMPSLLASIWGEDYVEKAEGLSASDNNFRRIYKECTLRVSDLKSGVLMAVLAMALLWMPLSGGAVESSKKKIRQ